MHAKVSFQHHWLQEFLQSLTEGPCSAPSSLTSRLYFAEFSPQGVMCPAPPPAAEGCLQTFREEPFWLWPESCQTPREQGWGTFVWTGLGPGLPTPRCHWGRSGVRW